MFKQIKLDYAFSDLEPHIDALTMETHYGKHHAGYTKNLNDTLAANNIKPASIEDLLINLNDLPAEIQTAVRNNGGGFYNHNLYFDHLSNTPKLVPTGALLDEITKEFDSLDNFKALITKAALGQFGSGWAWLVANKDGALKIVATANQDNPLMNNGGAWTPILGIDVWEHAYYLKHRNMRATYLTDFFQVLDWAKVEANYQKVIK